MHALILLPFFLLLQLCQAITSPDIYSLTQPAAASVALPEDSLPPTVPSKSRLAEQLHIGISFTEGAPIDMPLGRAPG